MHKDTNMPQTINFQNSFCCDCAWQGLRLQEDNREKETIYCRYLKEEVWANYYACPKFVQLQEPPYYKELEDDSNTNDATNDTNGATVAEGT